VEQYRRLCKAAYGKENGKHLQLMIDLGIISKDLDPAILDKIRALSDDFNSWFSRLCQEEHFDFSRHPDFIPQGKDVMRRFQNMRRYAQVNPNFIFLERTRYGLMRLFEQMGARVCFRNKYEWNPDN